ncbi:MAG: response regulator transcription factor [Candidatus Kapabacteria bacterium]|nr:response regulator transcription factor [Candidatus Kapabacteria bacterium]MCS7169235.1 response regulator transcription factor [Candidatus Kapabacteria bacterium]MDW7996991.1 response regulator transcription factor [Bacteroidota bacterium]MDW8225086.1 response regulator transcription factor [Bacteroidota bacterium]
MRQYIDKSASGIRISSEHIRIVIADDHEIVRVGLRHILSKHPNIELVGEAATGEEVIALARHHRPDVVLLDIVMPRVNGIEATRILRSMLPETRIIILTSYEDAFHVEQALRAGAHGYLTKTMQPQELLEAITAVIAGEQVFSPAIIAFVQDMHLAPPFSSAVNQPLVRLTPQESRVLQLIAEGLTTKEIAARLRISPRTVETHRSNLMDKLHARSIATLVRFALLNADYLSKLSQAP